MADHCQSDGDAVHGRRQESTSAVNDHLNAIAKAWSLMASKACRYYALNWGIEEEKIPCQQKILAYEHFLHSRGARHCFVCMGPNQEQPNSDAWDRKVNFGPHVHCQGPTPIAVMSKVMVLTIKHSANTWASDLRECAAVIPYILV